MSQGAIGQRRLVSQKIIGSTCADPGATVGWMGAMQAQDYLGALWAVGLRTPGATEQTVERALAERRIVRTWPMRGTIHFVPPADVRWMLELLAPRVVERTQPRLRQLGVDAATIAASAGVLTHALTGGRQLTRPAIFAALEAAGIATGGQRGYHIIGQLAHAALICHGPREGKQPTFTLLAEWAPEARSLPRDEALATLSLRYFTSHGPATLKDFVWWSGLTVAEARAGLAMAGDRLAQETIGGQSYAFAHDPAPAVVEPSVHLLPPFDEFLVSYRDRSASLDPAHADKIVPGGNGVFNPIIVVDGQVAGTWRRTLKPRSVELTFSTFAPLGDAETQALHATAEAYGRFLGLPATIAASDKQ